MEEFRIRLARAMDARGMKQVDLCEATGIAKSAVSQYLSGRIKPRQRRIRLLADVLGVDPGWLLGLDPAPLDENERYLLERYRSSAELRSRIDALLEEEPTVVFRAAKSEGGTVAPSKEVMSRARLELLRNAPQTDQDI